MITQFAKSVYPSRIGTRRALLAAALITALAPTYSAAADNVLADLSLEELGLIEVTSVSRTVESLMDAAAAVFVITRDDIVRAGVTSIPEALRLAPGVEVARRSAHAWSITIRGFNGDLANKLLVLIDGRSVYSPLYAGVFWDVQDTLLEDVDRIEVVSGPGGTLWGANAVNGVINIITRAASDTRGSYLELGGGAEERAFAGLRYGGDAGNETSFRTYLKYFDRDTSRMLSGDDAADDWHMVRAGFRVDSQLSDSDNLRLQGDVYDGEKSTVSLDDFTLGTLPAGSSIGTVDMSGANLMAEWSRPKGEVSGFQLQLYYDHTSRDIPNTYKESRNTLDIDWQQNIAIGERNDLLWGAAVRLTTDDLVNTTFATFDPASRSDHTYSLFLQDKIELRHDRWYLTIGSKFEWNDYTTFEVQPNLRLAWLIDARRTAWSAVSRAVRIPSRLDSDLHLTVPVANPSIPFPVYVTINGSNTFESEELLAYEAGFRMQTGNVFLDIAAFMNDYDGLQTTEPGAPVFVLPSYILLPNELANNMRGQSIGGTVSATWQPTSDWRLRFNYSYLDMHLKLRPRSLDQNAPNIAGNSPRHQVSVFSFLDFMDNYNLYLGLRYVGDLPSQGIDAYTTVDLSLRWRFSDHWHLSLTGQNLTDSGHPEFGSGQNEVERAAFLKISLSQ